MTHTEIVKKLVGSIQPVGETNTDCQRLENLKVMCAIVNDLVIEINRVSYENKDRYEHSMKEMSLYAEQFLTKTLGIV